MKPTRPLLYRAFKFRLLLDGRIAAGFTKASGIRMEGNPQDESPESAGSYEAITLERGLTHDPKFDAWASAIWEFGSARAGVSLRELRRDVRIEQVDAEGRLAATFQVYRCWVSEYQALPELDANSSVMAIQSLRLENEGWDSIPVS